jgi:hypothetical protein
LCGWLGFEAEVGEVPLEAGVGVPGGVVAACGLVEADGVLGKSFVIGVQGAQVFQKTEDLFLFPR